LRRAAQRPQASGVVYCALKMAFLGRLGSRSSWEYSL
jgi:hypothetical protein